MNYVPRHKQSHALRPTIARISADALKANFRQVRALAPPGTFVCPMLKANGYGHGLELVARVLRQEGARHVGVALIEEALTLRGEGDRGSILAFGLFLDRTSAEIAIQENVTIVANSWSQLQVLAEAAKQSSQPVDLHLEFNSGMNRHGFEVNEAARLREWIDDEPSLHLTGLATHLMSGDDAGLEKSVTTQQLQLFAQALPAFRGVQLDVHALNSGATLALARRVRDEAWTWGLRPGLTIYGVRPSPAADLQIELTPALSWVSRLAALHAVARGQVVSYDGTWTATRDSVIGVVPCGYADGFPRALSNRGSVLVRGARAPIVGRVCMDCFMVDLTDLPRDRLNGGGAVAEGDEVVLIGRQGSQEIHVEDVAQICGTITWEILTGIATRVPRVLTSQAGGSRA